MAIRPLGESDVDAFRALRLAALKHEPVAFLSSYEEESSRPLAVFAERVRGGDQARVFGAFDGEQLLGMVGLYRSEQRKIQHKAHIWGLYVRAEDRGRGLGRALMEAALGFARELVGLEQVGLVLRDAAPRAFYESLGFKTFGIEPRGILVDGQAYDEALLQLRLS